MSDSDTPYADRYAVPTDEGYEPGSNQTVLKNYAGITSKTTMDALERAKLKETSLRLVSEQDFEQEYQFTAQDICDIHELWLGDIYPFAGKYRTVTMTKDGFPFASPAQIPKLMQDFEKKYLKHYTPCMFSDIAELARALGVVHVELILIHPFREGNGRVARLLADLMIIQANRKPLNFTPIEPTVHPAGFKKYIHAIQAGLDEDYTPIQELFIALINVSGD